MEIKKSVFLPEPLSPNCPHYLNIFTPREEFTNYMFLERAQEAAGINAENWKLFPQVGTGRVWILAEHLKHDSSTCICILVALAWI